MTARRGISEKFSRPLIHVGWLLAFGLSCSDGTGFTGRADRGDPPQPPRTPRTADVGPTPRPSEVLQNGSIFISSGEDGPINRPFVVKPGDVTIEFENGLDIQTQGQQTSLPLSLVIVLDRSTSMRPYIDVVKQHMDGFVNNLSSQRIDADVALISFEDQPRLEIGLTNTSNINRFDGALANVNPPQGESDNIDFPEGSLASVANAIDLMARSARRESVKAVIVVSDAIGHNGGPGNTTADSRNCNTGDVERMFNQAASQSGTPVKLYYSISPDRQPESCGPYSDGAAQYDDLFANLERAQPNQKVGGKLAWPFTEGVLVNDLARELQRDAAGQNLTCRIESIEVLSRGQTLSRWPSNGQGPTTSATVPLADAIPFDLLRASGQEQFSANVIRCCDPGSPAPGSCRDRKQQSVNFTVQVER